MAPDPTVAMAGFLGTAILWSLHLGFLREWWPALWCPHKPWVVLSSEDPPVSTHLFLTLSFDY